MNRTGIALLAAIATLSIVALLVLGGLASVASSQASLDTGRTGAELLAAANEAIAEVLADWPSLAADTLPAGHTVQLPTHAHRDGIASGTTVTALPGYIYWIAADAESSTPAADRTVNLLVAYPIQLGIPRSALIARGPVQVGAGVRFTRTALSPVTDSCSAAASDVGTPSGAGLTLTAGADTTQPVVTASSQAQDSAAFWPWPTASLAMLRANATRLPAGASMRTVGAMLAISPGDVTLTGGSGSGILLVAGRMHITGPVSFSGIIVAAGGIEATPGASAVITGGLVAGDTARLADVAIHYSQCAMRHALARLPPRPVPGRSWMQLFGGQ